MNKETKRLNREAGRKNLIECVKHYKATGTHLTYIANHNGMLSNIYDYLHFTLKPVNWVDYREKAEVLLIQTMVDKCLMSTDQEEKLIIRKSLGYWGNYRLLPAIIEAVKEIAKTMNAEIYIKKLVDERACIEDL